jgi:anti-anti-sigma factor
MIELPVEHFDGIPVVRTPVDIDAANASRVRDELTAHTSQHSFELVVDLSETRYLDSAGIDMLFRLSRRLSERRATLRLVIRPESDLARLAEIVAIPSAIPVHNDVAQAIDAARRSRPAERVDQ